MFLQSIINALYTPNVWQNRLPDDLGIAIVVIGFLAVTVHFVVRHVRPAFKEAH